MTFFSHISLPFKCLSFRTPKREAIVYRARAMSGDPFQRRWMSLPENRLVCARQADHAYTTALGADFAEPHTESVATRSKRATATSPS